MTTPEHEPRHRIHDADHDQAPREQTGEDFIADLVRSAPSRETARVIERLYRQNGLPVALYLGFDDIDPYIRNLEDDYYLNYIGVYDTREHLIDDTLEGMGWLEPYKKLLRDWAIPEDALVWNEEAIWPRIQEMYQLVDIDGTLHVFAR